ncbi:hypothetical protein, partial [Burkholderia sp. Leaf177]|uniref:hypothetical protein n=1 Tax=Burkholderia sp. Leaf177 TaxID=1736287 RepID=UPI001F3A1FE9
IDFRPSPTPMPAPVGILLRGILLRATTTALSHFPSLRCEAKERNSSARFNTAQGVQQKNFIDA